MSTGGRLSCRGGYLLHSNPTRKVVLGADFDVW